MMIVQTVMTWYEKTWWVGTKEVLILLGFLVAAFTYRRNTVVRAQDVKAGQIQRTFDLMQRYPGETRELVLKATKALEAGFNEIDELEKEGADQETVTQLTSRLVEAVDLVGLLHRLDPWGYLVSRPKYLDKDEALNTFASEVRRILLNPRLTDNIEGILNVSTMKGIPLLIVELTRHQNLSTKT